MLRITPFRLGAGFVIRLWLSDGRVCDADVTEALEQAAFAQVKADRALYEQAFISSVDGCLSWPGDLDLDTHTLVGDRVPARK